MGEDGLNAFHFLQGGRIIPAETDGSVTLINAPFEVLYEGPCDGQAVCVTRTPALNHELTKRGGNRFWSLAGYGLARHEGDLCSTRPERVDLCEDEWSRARLASLMGSECPALLEGLISREPQLQFVAAIPSMHMTNRRLAFVSIDGTPIESCGPQDLYFTLIEIVQGFRPHGNFDWILKMRSQGIAVRIAMQATCTVANQVTTDTEDGGERALARGQGFYDSGDYLSAFQSLEEAATAGNVRAMYMAGYMLHNGLGVEQDCEFGRELLEAAAREGNVDALNYCGCAYSQGGSGFQKDYALSLQYLKAASDRGHADALANLGNMYYLGLGVPKDVHMAKSLYTTAKARGSAMGAMFLEMNT